MQKLLILAEDNFFKYLAYCWMREYNWINDAWANSDGAIWLSLVMFALLCGYLVWDSMRAEKEL